MKSNSIVKRAAKLAAMSIFLSFYSWATAPSGYYSSCENKGGEELLKALYSTISSHTTVGYDGLWNVYKTSDTKPNGLIWDMYSTKEWPTESQHCGNYKLVGDCYNREHSFPKSWFSKASPMYSDAFHLYPTDGKVNGQRSNLPYGECENGTTLPPNGDIKALGRLGNSTFPGYTGKVFEPDDQYKGDFARSYFYMAACYYDKIKGWSSPMLANNSYPAFTSWAVNLLLKWHRQDPVSDKEIKRNDAVYAYQKNRNPFIDHPELAEYIWGDKTSQKWNSGVAAAPQINMPVSGSTIDLGITAPGNFPLSKTIIVKGSNISSNVTLSCSNSNFSLSASSISASAANSETGYNLTVTFKASSVGNYTATLNIKSGDATSTVTLKASATDKLPAMPATDISEDEFTANWTYIGDTFDGGTYRLTVFDEDARQTFGVFNVNASLGYYKVTNLNPDTNYSYYIASASKTSSDIYVTTAPLLPDVNFYYDGDLNFSAEPGFPSEAAELLVEIENIDSPVTIEVDEPFELSTDKNSWSTSIILDPDEDRCYMRVNSATAGTFTTTITATADNYFNDDTSVQAIVTAQIDFLEDFETTITTSGYDGGQWNGSAAVWLFNNVGMYSADSKDAHGGSQCARFGKQTNSSIEMLTDKANGVGIVEFYAKQWTNADGKATITLQYSTDHGQTWSTATGNAEVNDNSYNKYSFTVNRPGNVRLRLQQTYGARCFVDDISATNYNTSAATDPTADYHAWDAYCRAGQLVIEAAAETTAAVYGVDGITYLNGLIAAGETTVSLPSGLYIVAIGDFTRRVMIK